MASIGQLVVDAQILQTSAARRGMGRFTLGLLDGLLLHAAVTAGPAPILISNPHLPPLDPDVENLPGWNTNRVRHQPLDALGVPADDNQAPEAERRSAAALERFIDTLDGGSVTFLLPTPFFVGYAPVLPHSSSSARAVTTAVVAHDLIPQRIWRTARVFDDARYFSHYRTLLAADVVLANSGATQKDLIDLVGVNPERVAVIGGAPYLDRAHAAALARDPGLIGPYILCPSGPIAHKNNEVAVAGFSAFNRANGGIYRLYFTSTFPQAEQARLRELDPGVAFSGDLDGDRLHGAYRDAAAVLFPSLIEGLGLPLLEASQWERPVVCSDLEVTAEVSPSAFYRFDPTDATDLAGALQRAVTGQGWAARHDNAAHLCDHWSWQSAADRAVAALEHTALGSKVPDDTSGGLLTLVAGDPATGDATGRLAEMLYGPLSWHQPMSADLAAPGPVKEPSFLRHVTSRNTRPGTTPEGERWTLTPGRRCLADRLADRHTVRVHRPGAPDRTVCLQRSTDLGPLHEVRWAASVDGKTIGPEQLATSLLADDGRGTAGTGRDSRRVLAVATYPAHDARQGGQKRFAALLDVYRQVFGEVRSASVYFRSSGLTGGPHDVALTSAETAPWEERYPASTDIVSAQAVTGIPRVKTAFTRLLSEYRPDIVHFEQPFMYLGLSDLLDEVGLYPTLVYGSENIEAPMKRESLAALGVPHAKVEELTALTDDLERRLSARADLLVACTPSDLAAHRAMGAERTLLGANGINPAATTPWAREQWRAELRRLGARRSVTFVAADHPPAVAGFDNMIGPALGFLPTDSRLLIVGNVGARLQERYQPDALSVEATTFWQRAHACGRLSEDDLGALLSLTDVVALPITSGGGSNLKAAEAILSGRRVVTTTYAMRSFEWFMDFPNVWVADTAEEFRQALVAALDAPLLPRSLPQVRQARTVQWDSQLRTFRAALGTL